MGYGKTNSFNNGVEMKKILFLYFALISMIASADDTQPTAELRLYDNNEPLRQNFIGYSELTNDNQIIIYRSDPTPSSETRKYAMWRVIDLVQDSTNHSIFHLGNNRPINKYCIVPFVNGVMSSNFEYDSDSNTIQFVNGTEPDIVPQEYSVKALILLHPAPVSQ